jgi:hypothetical protein
MDQLTIVLEFLSRAIALALAVGALLGFVFRRYVSAWIDAHFKRKVESEVKAIEHTFAVTLEEKKKALAAELNDETETLKNRLATQFERERHNLDEEFKNRARVFEERSRFAEPLARAAYDLQSRIWNILNQKPPRRPDSSPQAQGSNFVRAEFG